MRVANVFSTEIPEESNASDALEHFIGLNESPKAWATAILKYTKDNMLQRRSYAEEVRIAGFNSVEEGNKLVS